MPIAYFLLILISFIFSRFHFPFGNLIIVLSVLVLVADLITQLIRLLMQRIHISTLFGSIALLFVGIGYAFFWLSWPGSFLVATSGLVISIAYVVYWLIAKRNPTIRFVIILLVTMVLGVFVTMKESSFYCLKQNLDPNNLVAPVFVKHKLAWKYNGEQNYDAAMQLLLNEKKYLEKRLNEADERKTEAFYVQIFTEDLGIVNKAIVDLSLHSWKNFTPLLPEDFTD